MRPGHQEFTDGAKLALVATISAVLTATVVIGAGRTFLSDELRAPERAGLIPVALR